MIKSFHDFVTPSAKTTTFKTFEMIEIMGRWEVPKGTNKSFCIIRIVGIDCDKFVTNRLEQQS